ncbi:hypothetical protein ABH15_02400 [Methanoculleus taiwanensis]|uniref:Bacterial bifunctional deaminase-reductase C-terminal domain-containing protein n=1 Tax=Methanoculleus taiwanensis TaxID=1550565 RepID=A0A498H5I5_9EURY|nr:RibD family protein [Methanoculleus taiwanensis]RXE57006.1 hypothetical protein ABH15_02400 [Methanoculleus taiwanensis]
MGIYTILHSAVSIDGRLDWFSADIGLYYECAAHWQVDAVLAGSETMLAAEVLFPESPVEEGGDVPPADLPLLVVPDSKGRIAAWDRWRRAPYWRDIVVLCSDATPRAYLECLERAGIDCIVAGADRVDLRAALGELERRYGVTTLRVDSGGTLSGVLLREGLVDEVSLLVHPALVGGISPRSFFRAPDPVSPDAVIPCRLAHVGQLRGDIVWLRYTVG